jgi:hypothetical protein
MANTYSKLLAKMNNEKTRLDKKAENSGGFEKIEYFKPKTGDNMIRIIPNLADIENSIITVNVHFLPFVTKDGKEVNVPVRCLADYADSEACPACKRSKQLYDEGDKEEAKKYRAREQYLYTVLDYTGKKIAPYAMPLAAHKTILEFMEDLGESVFDIESGRDWKLVKKVDPAKGRIFGTEYTIRPSMKESAVPEKFKGLVEEITPLTDLYPEADQAKNKKRMLELLGVATGDDEDEDEAPAPKKTASKPAPAPAKKSTPAPAPAKKKAVVEEDEDDDFGFEEEEVAPKKSPAKKAAVDIDEDLEDELNSLLQDDE